LHLPPREVSREFTSQMGITFPRWRAQLRMSLARELLMLDEPPHYVSDFLGYANRATFSKIFTTAHGISPRSYQRQISKQPV
jgi:AraC-like DNA-binding protein